MVPQHVFVIIRRTTLALLALLAGLGPASVAARDIAIETRPIALNPEKPQRTQTGRLSWRGGLSLTSKEWRFGGLSSLAVSADGSQILAISDRASWLAFRPVLKDGQLVGVTDAEVRYIRDPQGGQWGDGERDSEGLAIDGTAAYVSFERDHRIMHYPLPDPANLRSVMTQNAMPGPKVEGLDQAPNNGGLESLVTLSPGRLLAVTEDARAADDAVKGWVIDQGTAQPLSYRTSGGYVPTDMALLPNGDVLTVERHFTVLTGVRARLCIIKGDTIVPGAALDCQRIAKLRRPMSVDNMEGVAVYRNQAGETIVLLVSDDNFAWNQRTLLMMFKLEEADSRP